MERSASPHNDRNAAVPHGVFHARGETVAGCYEAEHGAGEHLGVGFGVPAGRDVESVPERARGSVIRTEGYTCEARTKPRHSSQAVERTELTIRS